MNTDEEQEHTDDCFAERSPTVVRKRGEARTCIPTPLPDWILTCGMEEGEDAHTHWCCYSD